MPFQVAVRRRGGAFVANDERWQSQSRIVIMDSQTGKGFAMWWERKSE